MKLRATTFAAAAILAASAAFAEYPDKPVNFIVPWPPGDLEDQLTRLIADAVQESTGASAAVINKPGGGGGPFPGAIDTALAAPDGYTIGSFVMDVPIVGPQIGIPELSPNPFEPIGSFLTYPFAIVAAGDAPFKTLEELAEHSKSHDIALGHFGEGLTPTLVTLALSNRMGITYSAQAAFDALDCNTIASGDADVINSTLQLLLPCLDELTVLAAFTPDRIPIAPDAPTLQELAPDLEIELWNGLFVHKDVPAEARGVIAAIAKDTMMGEAAQAIAARTGAFVYWQDADETTRRIEQDAERLGVVESIANQ